MSNVTNDFKDLTLDDMGIDSKKWGKKVTLVCSKDVLDNMHFKDPTNFYYLNPFGFRVYLRTQSYQKAKEMVDEITGKEGFYSVRSSKGV